MAREVARARSGGGSTSSRPGRSGAPERSTLTRRRFLQGTALAPALGPALLAADRQAAAGRGLRVVVVGAGAFGGWTALHLRRAGAEVTLLDAWGPGNGRSSSGGVSRVLRAVYGADRIYTEMVSRSLGMWHELEATAGHHLFIETGALWMLHRDDEAYLRDSLPICAELGFPVEQPTLEAATRRWPQIDFDGIRRLYFEPRAGVLSARRSCQVLRRALLDAGGRYRTARALPGPIEDGRLRRVTLGDGSTLAADVFLFACGPWLGELFPELLGRAIRPTRQEVFYFGPPAGDDSYHPGRLPVWIDFGERLLYGLPDCHHRGFKIADDTRGEPIDPTTLDRRPSSAALKRARAFLAKRFPALRDAPLVESRVCQYENSPDGDLIVDRHPGAENLWIAGGGSGHGFKLAPALGERVAEAVVAGKELPRRFRLGRLPAIGGSSTQFEATRTR